MKLKPIIIKRKPNNNKGLQCLNCGNPFAGTENFCSHCGQKNTVKKLSFGVFVNNMASNFYSYDSRFWRTFIPLLLSPGYVSKQFIEGKRMRFVNPFQLYLNVSLIFFVILGIHEKFNNNSNAENMVKINPTTDSISKNQVILDSIFKESKKSIKDNLPKDTANAKVITNFGQAMELLKNAEKDSTKNNLTDNTTNKNPNALTTKLKTFYNFHSENSTIATNQALDSLGYPKTFWNKFYYQRVVDSKHSLNNLMNGNYKDFSKRFFSKISISLFLFLPLFTLFLWLLYWRRSYTYMEHLVFVFNTQTVFFLILIIFYTINFLVPLNNFGWVFILLFLLYLYKALRHFYGQGRIKTFLKFILVNTFYTFLGFIGIIILSIITFVVN